MELRYFVPFKAQEGVSADAAARDKLVNIEGVAIDTSVNANKWQVPEQDLQYVADGLSGAQLRVDHAESALMVVGKVTAASRDGQRVLFRAEVGDEKLINKILRGYVTHVSIQVDSDDVECSSCHKPTRLGGMLVHLCPGAWEVIHKPMVRELSIVASPAYADTAFVPVGFAAAMNKSQVDGRRLELLGRVSALKFKLDLFGRLEHVSQSFVTEGASDDEGSNREVQEPDGKTFVASEVKPLSERNSQQGASSHQAQGVTNTAPGEGKPTQVTYEDFMKQLQDLEKQINDSDASQADIDALKQKIADLEAQVAKRRSGRGIVAVDQVQTDALGDYRWFNDLLKAHKKLVGFQ